MKKTFFTRIFLMICLPIAAIWLPACRKQMQQTAAVPMVESNRFSDEYLNGKQVRIYLPERRNKATKVLLLVNSGKDAGVQQAEMLRRMWPECAVAEIYISDANTESASVRLAELAAAVKYVAVHSRAWHVSQDFALIGSGDAAQSAMLYTYTQNTNNYVKCVADLNGSALSNNNDIASSVTETYAKPTIVFETTKSVSAAQLQEALAGKGVAGEYYAYESVDQTRDIGQAVNFFRRNM